MDSMRESKSSNHTKEIHSSILCCGMYLQYGNNIFLDKGSILFFETGNTLFVETRSTGVTLFFTGHPRLDSSKLETFIAVPMDYSNPDEYFGSEFAPDKWEKAAIEKEKEEQDRRRKEEKSLKQMEEWKKDLENPYADFHDPKGAMLEVPLPTGLPLKP